MDTSYLLKVLLCDSIDRLQPLIHITRRMTCTPDAVLLKSLEFSARMIRTTEDASLKWQEHCQQCRDVHNSIQDEVNKRRLDSCQEDTNEP